METSQFDDFFKSKTQDELPVPTELSWENMNFPLPPAKRKRRIFPWLLFFLVGAVGIGSVLWYVNRHDNIQSSSLPKNDPTGIQNQNGKISSEKEEAGLEMAHSQDAGENAVPRNNATDQEISKTERPTGIETKEAKPLSLDQASKSDDLESAIAETPDLTASTLLADAKENNRINGESLAPFPFLNLLPVEPIHSTSPEKPLTPFSHAHPALHTKHAAKPVALLVSAGTNMAHMNHSRANLNDAETPDWGNSYQILLEKEVKDNWLISIGLGYQRLHTTFNYEKDLGTYDNFSQWQVIRRTRRVFHNNYFDLVALNLGGGKQFKLSPRWRGQLMMYLSPSHRLSYTGRSLDDSEAIIVLDPNTVAPNKWLWNADAALRFSYNLNKTALIIGFNLSQSLTKSDLLSGGNNMATVQPRVLGLNLGIRRSIGK